MCECIDRKRGGETEILRNWLTQLWKVASPKSAGRLAGYSQVRKIPS